MKTLHVLLALARPVITLAAMLAAMLAMMLAVSLLTGCGCRNPMNAPAMPSRPLTADEQAIVDHTRGLQEAGEMIDLLTAGRYYERSIPQ